MKLKPLIKILVSAVMLIVVLRMAKFDRLAITFQKIAIPDLVLVVVGYTAGQLLSSYKWSRIARSGGLIAPYTSALRAYFIGMYLNCFGLGTIGGDVARAIMLGQGQHKNAEAFASVVADRLHGLAVLSGIGAISACIFGINNMDPWLVTILVSLGGGIAIGWVVAPPLVLRFLPQRNKFRGKIEGVLAAFPRKPVVVLKITVVSIIFHLLQIALHRVMGLAVGVDLPWSFLLVTIPFVNILGTLPISWNGLGVRERAYVFFLVPAVMRSEDAVALGAMWLLAVTVSSAIGGIVAVLTKDFSKISEIDPSAASTDKILQEQN